MPIKGSLPPPFYTDLLHFETLNPQYGFGEGFPLARTASIDLGRNSSYSEECPSKGLKLQDPSRLVSFQVAVPTKSLFISYPGDPSLPSYKKASLLLSASQKHYIYKGRITFHFYLQMLYSCLLLSKGCKSIKIYSHMTNLSLCFILILDN